MADFCGLPQTGILWQKRPRRAVCFRSIRLSDCFYYGRSERIRTSDPLHPINKKWRISPGLRPLVPHICHNDLKDLIKYTRFWIISTVFFFEKMAIYIERRFDAGVSHQSLNPFQIRFSLDQNRRIEVP